MIGVVSARQRLLILAGVLALLCAALLASRGTHRSEAHPLGNFTVNRYSRIELYSDVVRVHYVFDMAEIPAFQERGAIDAGGDGEIDDGDAARYAEARATALADAIELTLDGQAVALRPVTQVVSFPAGQAGLDTIRLEVVYEAPAPRGAARLDYRDANFADRLGWREIVVVPGPGVTIEGEAPTNDVSRALTSYPADQLSSPLDVTAVSFGFDAANGELAPRVTELAGAPAAAPARAGGGFASLIDSENLTTTVVLVALLAAFAFGAVHALEPGHGKTLVAAYFVGAKGTARQALSLGIIIAVTHTVGVLAIGAVTLFGSQFILPERLYPWLSLASALMVLALGVRLIASRGGLRSLRSAFTRLRAHDSHTHGHGHHHHVPGAGAPPWKSLVALGLADGLTPSPSALVVLLAAVSLDRIGLGIALIVSFSVGLAAVLAGVSMALVFARRFFDRLGERLAPQGRSRPSFAAAQRWGMRIATGGGAVALVVVGAVLTVRALSQPGLTLFGL